MLACIGISTACGGHQRIKGTSSNFGNSCNLQVIGISTACGGHQRIKGTPSNFGNSCNLQVTVVIEIYILYSPVLLKDEI
jgi:hypothetical protein